MVSPVPGSFDLLFYTPPHYTISKTPNTQKHPFLINFYGGGFVIGHAGGDARWVTAITSQTSGVAVSVIYRLAPEHPFPIGIEDCVSAVLWLWSSGGNFAYTLAIRLHQELARMKDDGTLKEMETPNRLLEDSLPQRWFMINCGGDQLLVKAERFKKRLIGMGKKVDGYIVEGVGHGWNKTPTFKKSNIKRDQAYRIAVDSLQKA